MFPYILKNENAIFYECGFSCDNVYFLKLQNEAFFVTDGRYVKEARDVIKNAKVIHAKEGLLKSVSKIIKNKNIKQLCFNPKEWNVEEYENAKKEFRVKWVSKSNFSQIKRAIKSEDEIKVLQKSAKKGEKAFDAFAKFVRNHGVGLSEEELFFEAEKIFKNNGKLGLSFPPIVAINENAAKPHALPSKKILHEGDLLLLDAGVLYKRYCSDRTRVAEVGKNFNFSKEQKFSDKKRQKIYDIVLKAQKAGIKKVKAGIKACEVDKACRDVIEKAGFGEYFIHSTGHGVGIDIHELPVISANSNVTLKEGMVFSVEPGIYLPDEFGVRIEDVVVVTKKGAKVL